MEKLYLKRRMSFVEHSCIKCGKRVASPLAVKAADISAGESREINEKEEKLNQRINIDNNWQACRLKVKCPECKKKMHLAGAPYNNKDFTKFYFLHATLGSLLIAVIIGIIRTILSSIVGRNLYGDYIYIVLLAVLVPFIAIPIITRIVWLKKHKAIMADPNFEAPSYYSYKHLDELLARPAGKYVIAYVEKQKKA